MRRYLHVGIVILAAAGVYVWYEFAPTSTTISDATRPATLILRSKHPDGIYALTIVGKGNVEGRAEISLILNGSPYKTETLEGTVSFQWHGDWYSPEATVVYTPIAVTSGSITLRYSFSWL